MLRRRLARLGLGLELPGHDLRAGLVRARPEASGDVVLARKDVPSSYHLAVTVDDAAPGVTLVTRGEDLFEATHIHRLLQARDDERSGITEDVGDHRGHLHRRSGWDGADATSPDILWRPRGAGAKTG